MMLDSGDAEETKTQFLSSRGSWFIRRVRIHKQIIVNQCENHINECAQFIEGQMHFVGFYSKDL